MMTGSRHARPKSLAAALAAASLAAVALALFAAGAGAQSRHAPRVMTPTPTPTPEATPEGESESVSRSHASDNKKKGALVSFVVMDYSTGLMSMNSMEIDDLVNTFASRLDESQSVAVTRADGGSRSDARKRAKDETDAYVVLFEIEEDMGAGTGTYGNDPRTLTIKTYVFAPKTGDIKFVDTTYQRPYRQTATIGGLPIPVPSRRVEQYPSQLQLEQASRDAADRVLSRFNIMTPRD
ncbi:MAG TPA: hypothetical protein VFA21_21340 [Pyrinomonadaceae bacterium]|nr:hypothetical protein [Pyrinomonadaceae bacterium]